MTSILIGTLQNMQVEEKQGNGWILKNELGKAFLPTENENAGYSDDIQKVDVFLYKGEDGRVTATTALPEIEAGTFGWGTITEVDAALGAFVNIGTVFTILLPKGDLPAIGSVWPFPGDSVYLRLKRDGKDRLLAIPAKAHELDDLFIDASDVELNDPVKGRIIRAGKEGSLMVTEEAYRGFIHHTERDQEPRLGELVSGRVIEVKEDETLNISLLPLKHERIDDDAAKIFAYIEANDGDIPFGNKSDPELVKNTLGMSKSAFKRAVGRLMKEGKIETEDERITQVKE